MQSEDSEARRATRQGLMVLRADSRPQRRLDVHVRVIDGETVVLDREGGYIHQLNRTASLIWNRCDGQSTLAEIAGELAEVFDVDVQSAAVDTARAVEQLFQLHLLIPDVGTASDQMLVQGEEVL